MKTQTAFNRLILRAVLRKVSPMVIRVLAIPDSLDLSSFDEVFRTLLDWGGLGFSFHIHGQEFTSFLRRTRTRWKALRDFQLRPRETFLYTCGGIDLWEWELRLLASETGSEGDDAAVCLAGRGASPPEYCGGPTGYRLMLKRQKEGDAMSEPAQIEAVIAML
ncbi:MAG: IS1096 element passenger TnpR family protein, partial [Terriglobia bacterium]